MVCARALAIVDYSIFSEKNYGLTLCVILKLLLCRDLDNQGVRGQLGDNVVALQHLQNL